MKRKWIKWFCLITILTGSFLTAGLSVMADDDDDERYENHGYYEERGEGNRYENNEGYENDGDDDEGYEDEEGGYEQGYGNEQTVPTQRGYWNFWIREAISSQDTNLPVTQPGEVVVKINGVSAGNIHIVPQDGQLLIPGEQVAKLLNAKTEYYPKSRILVISKNKSELIVRAGSNAAYENKNKTPMPMKAQYIETALYLPISVVANTLGYRVSWDDAEQSLILENL
jgi:hypothetical protein